MPFAALLSPMIGAGTRDDPYRAKHQRGAEVIRASSVFYSPTDHAVLVLEASQTHIDTAVADPEVRLLATPATIDDALTAGQVNNVQSYLEARDIPAEWLQAGETRRMALRGVIGIFLFAQRYEGTYGKGFRQAVIDYGLTLNSAWSIFPQAFKDELVAVRDSLRVGDLQVTNATTLRQILRRAGNRWQATTFNLSGISI